jgi:hypothetical protein
MHLFGLESPALSSRPGVACAQDIPIDVKLGLLRSLTIASEDILRDSHCCLPDVYLSRQYWNSSMARFRRPRFGVMNSSRIERKLPRAGGLKKAKMADVE